MAYDNRSMESNGSQEVWCSRNRKVASKMYSYLEKFLWETAGAAWEAYKLNYPAYFTRDLELGANPYNYTNKIQISLLGYQSNTGVGKQQHDAIRKLEQIQIKKWIFTKPLLQYFMYYSTVAGCFNHKTLRENCLWNYQNP